MRSAWSLRSLEVASDRSAHTDSPRDARLMTAAVRDQRVDEIMCGAYTLIVTRDPEGTYSAQVLELPGCFSGGATAAKAASNIEDAMALWIESELEQGRPIPEPTGAEGLARPLRYED